MLLLYRSTRSNGDSLSPAEAAFGRRLRTKQTIHKVDLEEEKKEKSEFKVGDLVWIRMYSGNVRWRQGKIAQVTGRVTYMVELDGTIMSRHRDQLMPAVEFVIEEEKSTKTNKDTVGKNNLHNTVTKSTVIPEAREELENSRTTKIKVYKQKNKTRDSVVPYSLRQRKVVNYKVNVVMNMNDKRKAARGNRSKNDNNKSDSDQALSSVDGLMVERHQLRVKRREQIRAIKSLEKEARVAANRTLDKIEQIKHHLKKLDLRKRDVEKLSVRTSESQRRIFKKS